MTLTIMATVILVSLTSSVLVWNTGTNDVRRTVMTMTLLDTNGRYVSLLLQTKVILHLRLVYL